MTKTAVRNAREMIAEPAPPPQRRTTPQRSPEMRSEVRYKKTGIDFFYSMCDLYVSGQNRYRDSHSTRTVASHARRSSHKLNCTPNHDLGWVEATSQLHDSRQVDLRPDFVSFCKTDQILASNG